MKPLKAIIVMALAIVLITLPLAGCATNDDTASVTSSAGGSDTPSGNTSNTPAPAESGDTLERITLTLYREGGGMDPPYGDTVIGKEIERATGIHMEVIWGDQDNLMLLAAGGDLPDIIKLWGSDPTLGLSLIDSKQVIPLDGLLASHGQNILRRNTGIESLKKTFGTDQTYFLPSGIAPANLDNPVHNGEWGFCPRFDLYLGVGAPEMNNEDDFLNMLRQIQDAQPVALSGNPAYALSAWVDWSWDPFIAPYIYSYGYKHLGNNTHYNIEDGSFSGMLDPDGIVWRAFEFWYKANQLGILDPEALVMDRATYDGSKFPDGEIRKVIPAWFTCNGFGMGS